MKFKLVTFAKINNRWRNMTDNSVLINGRKNAFFALIEAHTKLRGKALSEKYDVENVTKIMHAGEMKNTDSFEVFFDYTFDDGIVHERRRIAICRVA